jgi:SET domain
MGKVIVVTADVVPRLRLQLVASEVIKLGELIVQFTDQEIQEVRTWRTMQLDCNRHVRNEFLNYVDHSCEPNALLEIDSLSLMAIRDIPKKQPVTCFYPGSEVELATEFPCKCGKARCLRQIKGGFYLTHEQMRWALDQRHCTSFMQKHFLRFLGGCD